VQQNSGLQASESQLVDLDREEFNQCAKTIQKAGSQASTEAINQLLGLQSKGYSVPDARSLPFTHWSLRHVGAVKHKLELTDVNFKFSGLMGPNTLFRSESKRKAF
jgi:hypothetical protein